MKFRKGDKVRVFTEEEILDKFGELRIGEHNIYFDMKEYLGKEMTVRLVRPKTCRLMGTKRATMSFPHEVLEHTKEYQWECYVCNHGTNDLYELPQANIPVCKKCANDIAKQLIDNLLS